MSIASPVGRAGWRNVTGDTAIPQLRRNGVWGPLYRDAVTLTDFDTPQAAATAAGVNGIVLVPAGTHTVAISGTSAVIPPDGQVWAGVGRASIIATEATLTADGQIFAPPVGARFTLRDIALAGPASPAGFNGRGINHGGTSGEVHASRVHVSNLTNFIRSDAGAVWLDVQDCDISVHGAAGVGGSGILHNGDTTGSIVTSHRNVYRAYGLGSSNQEHALYVKTGTAVASADDRFLANSGTGYAIVSAGGSGTPDFFTVDRGYFGPGTYHGILTPTTKRALVRGCVFESAVDPGSGNATYAVRNAFEADVLDCHFNMTRTTVGKTLGLLTDANGAKFRIRGNFFASTGGGMFATGAKTGTEWFLDGGNRFPNLPNATTILGSSGTPLIIGDWVGNVVKAYGTVGNGATVFPGCEAGNYITLSVSGTTSAITITTPANPARGMRLTFDITCSASVSLAVTWAAAFLLAGAWVDPAPTKRRTITFIYDGTNWLEIARAAADI